MNVRKSVKFLHCSEPLVTWFRSVQMLVTQIPQAGSGSSSLPGQALVGRGSELLRCAAQWSLRDVLQTDVVAERQAYSLMMPAIQRTSAWLMLAMHHSLWLMSLP